jgi:chromosome segregation ATPase
LDLNQAVQLLTWLDKEHRKDKVLLVDLQSQVEVQKAQLTEQARQFQQVQAALARIEGELPKVALIESALQGIRTEFAALLARQTLNQEGLDDKRIQADRQESESIARIVRQVQERVDSLGTYENTIADLRDTDRQLRSQVAESLEKLSDVARQVDEQSPQLAQLQGEMGGVRDTLAGAQLAIEDLSSKCMQLKADLDVAGPTHTARMDQLQAALEELRGRRRSEADTVQVRQQDLARRIDTLQADSKAVQALTSRWSTQMAEFAEQFERNRKALHSIRELESTVRQQGKEMIELQQITAERQRSDVREWQDGQLRVDEEQDARLHELESWRARAADTLSAVEESLRQNRQALEAASSALWKAWVDYGRGQMNLVNSIINEQGTG